MGGRGISNDKFDLSKNTSPKRQTHREMGAQSIGPPGKEAAELPKGLVFWEVQMKKQSCPTAYPSYSEFPPSGELHLLISGAIADSVRSGRRPASA
jgi:hypothetical protein